MKLSTLLLCYKGNLAHWSKDQGYEDQAYRDHKAAFLRNLRRTNPVAVRVDRIACVAGLFSRARIVRHRDGRMSITTK